MREGYLIGLDIGTGGTKGLLVTPEGSVVARAVADYPLYTPRPGWSEQRPEDWWRAAISVLRELSHEADGDRIVGIVEYVTREASIYVRGLAVHPEFRRQGVARAMLSEVARVARQLNLSKLTLSTIRETGNPAIFERLGFVAKGVHESHRFVDADDRPVTQVDMVYPLIKGQRIA